MHESYPEFKNPPVFGEKPARIGSKGRPSTWKPRLDYLRSQPGKWANFGEVNNAASYARGIRKGLVGKAAPDEFEARVHNRQLWVRYVGDGTVNLTTDLAHLLDQWPEGISPELRDAILKIASTYS